MGNFEIMQCSASVKDMVNKEIFSQPAFIFNDTVSLSAADYMFHPYSACSYVPIEKLLFFSPFPAFRFLYRLIYPYSFRPVSLIAGVLPQGIARRDVTASVRHSFVVNPAACAGLT
jgi:hypothetical protein